MKKVIWALTLCLFAPYVSADDRTISVAQGGGDFYDPIVAINSITDASDLKRYLVTVGPGVYFLSGRQLRMKPYISLVGSGTESTVIQSFRTSAMPGPNSGVIRTAEHSTIKHLTVRNHGNDASTVACGITMSGVRNNSIIDDVNIRLKGLSKLKCGIDATDATVELKNIKINIRNFASDSTGILSHGSASLTITSVEAFVSSTNGIGLSLIDSSSDIENSNFSSITGVLIERAHVTMNNSRAWRHRGFVNLSPDPSPDQSHTQVRINNSVLTTIDFANNPHIHLRDTQVFGGLANDALGQQCFRSYGKTLAADLVC